MPHLRTTGSVTTRLTRARVRSASPAFPRPENCAGRLAAAHQMQGFLARFVSRQPTVAQRLLEQTGALQTKDVPALALHLLAAANRFGASRADARAGWQVRRTGPHGFRKQALNGRCHGTQTGGSGASAHATSVGARRHGRGARSGDLPIGNLRCRNLPPPPPRE